ncbi:MAG: DUF460 domain-containing protein [Candidatus Aenigmarchaeota archaeon]|nr:DUF460 domain-containing protein [Candidatus Aenigmarchaeota archaeon]
MRQKLIVGIDPGVTTAVVILGLNGRIVDAKSRKFFSFSEITSSISAAGDPLIISSDVNPPPRLVHRVASAFGARLHYPSELITAAKKAEMGKSLFHKLNDHERDAYAAALMAFEYFRRDFEKIDSMVADSTSADNAKAALVKGSGVREAVESLNVKASGNADENLRKALEDRSKEVGMLRRMLNFYRKDKAAAGRNNVVVETKTPRLESELAATKQRADKAEDGMRSARRLFRRLMEGWVPAFVFADFRKDSLKRIESSDVNGRWLIFLSNEGISREALASIGSKGAQGIVCDNSRIISEFKTLSHLSPTETEFECAESMGAINPGSMKDDMESVRSDFIKWARRVSDG